MYLSLLGNLSLWSVTSNASSIFSNTKVGVQKQKVKIVRFNKVQIYTDLYIFIVTEQAFGYGVGELDTMCDEGISQDKLQLMLNPNTATDDVNTTASSDKGGRPTKTSSQMTESSQVSQDINGEQKSEVI